MKFVNALLLFMLFRPLIGQKQPNVILILTDDQGYGDMACHGNPYLKTPQMTKLYNESVRFTDFHVDPMCAPTRAALMSGKYASRTGVWATIYGRHLMNHEEITLAQQFKKGGYTTAMFGKWHLGATWPYRPNDRGFDESLTFGGGVIGETPDYWNNHYFEGHYIRNGKNLEKRSKYCTDLWFDETQNFIQKNKTKPFFVYLALNAAHGPFDVAPKYSQPFMDLAIPHMAKKQYGLIENIDENLGKLRQFLQNQELAKNTILIFMGDNGAVVGARVYNAHMRGWKTQSLNGGHRTFCFVHWPERNLNNGRDIDALAAHIDLTPTLAKWCNLKLINKKDLDGKDLSPVVFNNDPKWNKKRVLVVHNQQVNQPQKFKEFEVLHNGYRLTKSSKNNEETWLTKIKEDSYQKNDLSKKEPKKVKKMLGLYNKWWKHISDRFEETPPHFIGGKQNPILITAHALHNTTKKTYNQRHIREAPLTEGYWPIRVVKKGQYRFQLSRWPIESHLKICEGVVARKNIPNVTDSPEGIALDIKKMSISIANKQLEKSVSEEDYSISFDIELNKGDFQLQTTMTDSKNNKRAAYYVTVTKLN